MPRQNLQAASKAALLSSRLDQISGLGTDASQFEDAGSAMESKVGAFIDRVKNNLIEANMRVTGKSADITVETTDTSINIIAPASLIYQDKGVNGAVNKLFDTPFSFKTKKPPMHVFKDWIITKNIQLRNNTDYRGEASPFNHLTADEEIESAAYAMREEAFKNGLPPRNVYSKEIPQLADDVGEELATFSIEQILESFK